MTASLAVGPRRDRRPLGDRHLRRHDPAGAIIVHFLLASIGTLSPDFLVGDPSRTELGGIGPLICNSLYILVLTLLITVPLGIARRDLHGRVRGRWPAPEPRSACRQELISSVPSIVVGLFGLALFVNATGWSFTRARRARSR